MSDENEYWDDDDLDDYGDLFDLDDDDATGTSRREGLCDPQCSWCLVSHDCPNDCAGDVCPYVELAEG